MNEIQLIKARVSLLETINRYSPNPLVKKGSHYWMNCPFHADKTPSLQVKNEKWRCYSCNEYGDMFDFVAKATGLNLKDTIQLIASDYGISEGKLSPEKVEQIKATEYQRRKDRLREKCNELIRNKQIMELIEIEKKYHLILEIIDEPEDLEREEVIEALSSLSIVEYRLDCLFSN